MHFFAHTCISAHVCANVSIHVLDDGCHALVAISQRAKQEKKQQSRRGVVNSVAARMRQICTIETGWQC